MRPRLRSRTGPNAPRDGRPLELVRVRGPQRDPDDQGRAIERTGRRARRRGGRGRGRGPRQPAPTRRAFSFLAWLKGLLALPRTARPQAPRGRAGLSDQESRALAEFCRRYGLAFRDPALLRLALTHRSYLHVSGQGPRESNERLEFLGDSVLGLVTSEFLYRSHPGEHEGQLTKTKSLLVSKAILSRRALAMGLGRFVFMSHSEVESGGRQRLSILADAFESVIGAIYLDQGYEAARAFIERWLLHEAQVIVADKRHTNYKSHLQEYVQSTFRTHPVYRIRSEVGPDHSKQFMVEVLVARRVLGQGRGRNKKEAEQAAARNALAAVERGPVSDREARRAERPAARARPETNEEGERSRRRRRGRRGGRGRRDPALGAPDGLEPAAAGPSEDRPRVNESTVRPVRQDARERPAVGEPSSRLVPPAELEPRPSAFEEDENEEVGRPEGPYMGGRGERHVDPFAWDVSGARGEAADERGGEGGGLGARPAPSIAHAQGETPGAAAARPFASDERAAATGPPDRFTEPPWREEPSGGQWAREPREEDEGLDEPTHRLAEERAEIPPPAETDDEGEAEAGPHRPDTPPPAPPAWGRRARRGR